MAPLRISFHIRSVYDFLPSNANLVRWGKKEDPTCPLCQGRQTTEHVLSSCKIALSQGRYTWRHNRVLQELAAIISTAKGETTLPNTNALIFTTEGGAKSWHGSFHTTIDHGGANSTIRKQNEEAHIHKREKYMNLTKELENAGYKAVVMPVEDQLAPRSAIHQEMTMWVRILALCKKKDNRETPGNHDLGVARPP
ncbi:hypothetical protein RRG08_066386 [Elysia crispata]|uniref:Reverse transcriptase zinc-binding domain-containing protein n=1 Tax=Elysia crispata TaxID=231223 RepID=A0AAE1D4A6_9GAST|nr:hypothetical protein RRG08_066386 [Elysia crispata]